MRLDTGSKEHYNIMCALRGPDGRGAFAAACKALFTARIRYWVGCDKSNGYYRRAEATEEHHIEEALHNAPKSKPPPWWWHYRNHIESAIKSLLRVSSKSLKGFSRQEADQLLAALYKVDAAMYDP